MTRDEFRIEYSRKSKALLGVTAPDDRIHDSYENYKKLVELTGSEGTIDLINEDGNISVEFQP